MDTIHQSKDVEFLNRLKKKKEKKLYMPTETNSKGIGKYSFIQMEMKRNLKYFYSNHTKYTL